MPTVALINPKIPQNTGTIARLCAATNTPLHIVGEMGFSLEDKYLKRAGLDYWPEVNLTQFENIDDYLNSYDLSSLIFITTKSKTPYTKAPFNPNSILIFGAETVGLPPELYKTYKNNLYTIPMTNPKIRSLNLAISVGIVLYESFK